MMKYESKNIEYKSERPSDYKKYMKTVVAFSNSGGGKLIFGIDDKTLKTVGIDSRIILQEMDAITNAISDTCEPMIIPDISLQNIEDKDVIVVEIEKGKQRPYYIKSLGLEDGTYIRVSGTTRKADRDIMREMYYEDEGRSFDRVIRTDIAITEDDINKLCKKIKEVAIKNSSDDFEKEKVKDITKNILINWGVLVEKNGEVFPTNAYVFLTGQDPFSSEIQCAMFKGKSKGIFIDKREYGGPLWEQIEESLNFILRNIRLGAKIEGIYRKDFYELPPDNIRELIINAVMNCSFIQSSRIQIAIYDDRLEITSPGGLMPGVTIEKMKEGFSKIRNKALARVFSYMNLVEEWGSGIPKLMEAMKEYGLSEPEFIDLGIGFRINLYRKDYTNDKYTYTQKMQENHKDTVEEDIFSYKSEGQNSEQFPHYEEERKYLTEQERKILLYLANEDSITSAQVEKLLNIKQRRSRTILSAMAEKNILEKIGNYKNTRYVLK